MKTEGMVMDCVSHPKGGWSATVHFEREVPVGTRLAPQPAQQAVEGGQRTFAVVDCRRTPSGRYSHTVESDWPLPIGALLHVHPAPQPAQQAQLLTDAEITECRTHNLLHMTDGVLIEFSRAIEQAVLKKNGLLS